MCLFAQVQVLSNADFAASQASAAASLEPTPETLRLRNNIKTEQSSTPQQQQQQPEAEQTQEIQIVMKTDEHGRQYTQIISEGGGTKSEDGQLVVPNIDPNSPEMAMLLERIRQGQMQVAEDGTIVVNAEDLRADYSQLQNSTAMAQQPKLEPMPDYDFGPGVINPLTGEMEEPDASEFVEPEPDVTHQELFVNDAEDDEDDDIRMQVETFGSKYRRSTTTTVRASGPSMYSSSQMVDPNKGGDSEESDFDEENLTPKVVYERLLAQHRRTKECQVCGELLDNFLRLKEHLMEHAGYNPCECQKCGRILGTPEGRYRHEKAHEKHGSPTKGMTPPQKVTCTVCGKIIARKEHLKRHMLIHQDCPTYKCLLCGYSFKREDLIKGHVKKFHPKQVEASSLDLLFEKSSDETAPERSQWNPHRKYRTTPRPPKIPGRGRGRPRKDGSDLAKLDRFSKDIIIKTPDGSIVKPRPAAGRGSVMQTPDGRTMQRATPASNRGASAKGADDSLADDNSSEDSYAQLLVGRDDVSDSSMSGVFSTEKPSRTSQNKKARSAATPRRLNEPIWGHKKSVKVSFIGE